jgi:hypothetical protein
LGRKVALVIGRGQLNQSVNLRSYTSTAQAGFKTNSGQHVPIKKPRFIPERTRTYFPTRKASPTRTPGTAFLSECSSPVKTRASSKLNRDLLQHVQAPTLSSLTPKKATPARYTTKTPPMKHFYVTEDSIAKPDIPTFPSVSTKVAHTPKFTEESQLFSP